MAVAYEKQYNQNHVAVYNAFQTNGYGITREWCDFFRENHFLVGLSVDGTRKIHNSLRHERGTGKPTFDRVLECAELMEKCGVNYNILTVVTREIAGNIEEVYASYKKRGWHYQQYIACLEPLGEKQGGAFYSLNPEDYGTCLKTLGAMLAMNSFSGVICGHVEDPVDAYTFAHVNDGNAVAIPFAKGFGWGGELNLEYIFEKLFGFGHGQGYPRERVEPEMRNKRILDEVRAQTLCPLLESLPKLDKELVKGAVAGDHFKELFFASCKDEAIAAYVRLLHEVK